MQDTSRSARRPSPLRWAVTAALAFGALAGGACGPARTSTGGPDAGPAASALGDLSRAHGLVAGHTALPARADVLALAQSIEGRAVREGAGARASPLHMAAAKLFERVWRVEGREQDAIEAVELYRAAAIDVEAAGACDAALAGAMLAGDVARDAVATYGELYRVQRRFAAREPSSCGRNVEAALSSLAAFRPPQRVLEAIDEGLRGEGTAAQAAGTAIDMSGSAPMRPPRILRIESWPGRDSARVVVVLDRSAAYRIGDEMLAGTAAPHTFLDLDGVDLGDAPRDAPLLGIVTRVRAESTSTGSRVSFDLDGRAYRRVFYMVEPYRIVVDVARRPPGAVGRDARAVSRLALDPGHGGKDTGATGPAGVREKDVTLDIAHRVAPILAAQGVQIVLTRDDDRFVPLEERTARANAFSADLFVSIHCNASENKGRRGIETYVLDFTRDEIAVRVAARENATTQAASAELASILGDLRLADEAQRSTRFAQLMERSAMAALRMKYVDAVDGGVHTAGFYVLVGARMPSVLFETSYLSNPVEEQRLGSDDYRQALADAIANAVKAYREGR
jgi:N-acetylmuramoyl-L-alanine amidase